MGPRPCTHLARPGWLTRKAKKDGIYRASLRGDSTYVRAQAEAVAAELLKGNSRVEPGKHKLVETRKAIEGGWRSVANLLIKDGHCDLADNVQRFIERMPPPRTEREVIAPVSTRRSSYRSSGESSIIVARMISAAASGRVLMSGCNAPP
jgi:hypothetical protein